MAEDRPNAFVSPYGDPLENLARVKEEAKKQLRERLAERHRNRATTSKADEPKRVDVQEPKQVDVPSPRESSSTSELLLDSFKPRKQPKQKTPENGPEGSSPSVRRTTESLFVTDTPEPTSAAAELKKRLSRPVEDVAKQSLSQKSSKGLPASVVNPIASASIAKRPAGTSSPVRPTSSGSATARRAATISSAVQPISSAPVAAERSAAMSSATAPISSASTTTKRPAATLPTTEAATTSLTTSKRPAATASSTVVRSDSFMSLPKIAKRTSVASPQSPDRDEQTELATVGTERPPKWYKDLALPNVRGKNDANVDVLLQRLRTQITKCQSPQLAQTSKSAVFNEIRELLHTVIFETVSAVLLKRNRMLHNEDGLPQLFDELFMRGVDYPFDIKADARELYNKWCRRVFETDIFRGIKFDMSSESKKAEGKNSDKIDPSYVTVSAKYHGNGDLLNGQWWPSQLCALRDGAHGASQSGIFGLEGQGAWSCIMSGGHGYPDKDEGNLVSYCGTDSANGTITDNTRFMLDSVTKKRPVRLIRSHNLKSEYAPTEGFRYDGLYDVISFERLDPPDSVRQRYRFNLVRLAGQDPIRGGNTPATRPTAQEKKQLKNHRRFTGKSSS